MIRTIIFTSLCSVECFFIFIPADVTLTPSHGNQLGGTPVLVKGFHLESNDSIICIFDGIASVGTYVDARTALCVTPVMNTQGIVTVDVRIFSGSSRDTSSAVFTTCESTSSMHYMLLVILL